MPNSISTESAIAFVKQAISEALNQSPEEAYKTMRKFCVESVTKDIQSAGLQNFKITCDETNNTEEDIRVGHLKVTIEFSPEMRQLLDDF